MPAPPKASKEKRLHQCKVLLSMAMYLRDGGYIDLANFLVRMIPHPKLSTLQLDSIPLPLPYPLMEPLAEADENPLFGSEITHDLIVAITLPESEYQSVVQRAVRSARASKAAWMKKKEKRQQRTEGKPSACL